MTKHESFLECFRSEFPHLPFNADALLNRMLLKFFNAGVAAAKQAPPVVDGFAPGATWFLEKTLRRMG